MGRRYPARPVVGVGAVVVRRGCVLMVERGRAPMKGYWSLPGGVLNPGELLQDGVRREVKEETGIEVRPLGVGEVFERLLRDRRGRLLYHYVLIDYLCRAVGGRLRAADDASSARWIRLEDLNRYPITAGTMEVILRVVRRGRRGLLGT
ncbi:MAG TPA: NUDIX hydrolase [Bryobacteraceae bacterium]|nr:NUDIX hydrolase [Bryobacteraceae bacterium]